MYLICIMLFPFTKNECRKQTLSSMRGIYKVDKHVPEREKNDWQKKLVH